MKNPTYYDGDLAQDLIEAALEVIAEDGPAAVSIRSLARSLGVSHAAPKNHFDDKATLFAAIAAQGFSELGDALRTAAKTDPPAGSFVETGVAYVAFALAHPAHFAVMWSPGLLAETDELTAAKLHARSALAETAQSAGSSPDGATQAWALAHGWASLLIGGAFTAPTEDPLEYVRLQFENAANAVVALRQAEG